MLFGVGCTMIIAILAGPSGLAMRAHVATAETPVAEPEATSLLGEPLFPLPLSAEKKAQLLENLATARAAYEGDPNDVERLIWLGRRHAYLGHYRQAIAIYTRGIAAWPRNPKLYRHRGHRYITVRQFDDAIEDLERAATLVAGQPDEVEPDGAPNAFNIPRSTLHSNIWYHLGLAYYLKGDLENALRSYRECMRFSRVNDDMLCATSDWLYMTLRRLGRDEEARRVLEPIHAEMEILENDSYHRRLMMYRGERSVESLLQVKGDDGLALATQGYGVGNWYFYNGEVDKAKAVFERVLAGPWWPAFGYIAAEADLSRLD